MSDKVIGYFFIMKDGKPVKYGWLKGEYEEYKKICFTIWGGMPHDVKWAKTTKIYQSQLK